MIISHSFASLKIFVRYLIPLLSLFLFSSIPGFCSPDNSSFLVKKNISHGVYSLDSEASVIIINEERSVTITREVHGSGVVFSQRYHVNRMIKFLNTTDMAPAAVHVYHRKNDLYNYIENVEGRTYNLESNEIKDTRLNKHDVFTKEVKEDLYETTFSLPSVKEGSIIEYSYDLVSSVRDVLPEWNIQGKYAKLITSYEVTYPQNFEYTSVAHVRPRKVIYPSVNSALVGADEFCQVNTVPGTPQMPVSCFWMRRNVPAIKAEPYVYNTENNLETMSLQITGFLDVNGMTHVGNTWAKMDKILLDNKNFGAVNKQNRFLDGILDSLRKAAPDGPELTRAIYNYVRAEYSLNNDKSSLYSSRSIQEVFRNKQGSVAEINMLLCALLANAELDAAPLLLGTTANVSPNVIFPTLDRFNYLACVVARGPGYLLLDASDKNNAYGMLPINCYNGYARVLKGRGEGDGIDLTTEMIKDKGLTGIRISGITDTSADIEITRKFGIPESSTLRKAWHEDDGLRQKFIDNLVNDQHKDLTITSSSVQMEENPDTNLMIKLSGVMHFDKNTNVLYLNAFMAKKLNKNPFTAAQRNLPIEYPCQQQDEYYISIVLPKGYEFADIPKSAGMDIDSGAMHYEVNYIYYEAMRTLTIKSAFTVNVTTYSAESYSQVKAFYHDMMKEENAVLTIKKTGQN